MELEFITKLMVFLLVFNLVILFFAAVVATDLPINNPAITALNVSESAIQSAVSGVSSSLSVTLIATTDTGSIGAAIWVANAIWRGISFVGSFIAFLGIGVAVTVQIVFLILPSIINFSFGNTDIARLFAVFYFIATILLSLYGLVSVIGFFRGRKP